jgi:hypothetical protein
MNHMGSINNPRVATNNKRFGRGRLATAPEHYRPAGGGAWGEPPGRSVGKVSRRIFVPWNPEKNRRGTRRKPARAAEQTRAIRDCLDDESKRNHPVLGLTNARQHSPNGRGWAPSGKRGNWTLSRRDVRFLVARSPSRAPDVAAGGNRSGRAFRRLPPCSGSAIGLITSVAARPSSDQRHQRLLATSANIARCGSKHCTIQPPPGTWCGPMSTFPPASFARPAAASIASTLK